MRRIKIPQQDFALKTQGGLCTSGGIFAGHYGTFMKITGMMLLEGGRVTS